MRAQHADPAVLNDDDVEEVSSGVFRRVGDCSDSDLEAAIVLREEKTRLLGEIVALKRSALERDLKLPRRMRRELVKLQARFDRTGALRDVQRLHEVLAAVVNGGGTRV